MTYVFLRHHNMWFFYEDCYMISFVHLLIFNNLIIQIFNNFTSAKKVAFINAVVLMLYIVQYFHSCILIFLVPMFVKGLCLIE